MKVRGRPKKDKEVVRAESYLLRMTEEEAKTLDIISEATGLSKADVLRKGLNMYHNLVKVTHLSDIQ